MKKLFLVIIAALALINVSNAQNDSLYIMKSGVVVAKYNVNTDVDSIIFYNPNIKNITSDTTNINIATTTVGATDYSSAWWTVWSDYFTIPTNKLLHLEFVNYSAEANNWNNWDLDVTNPTTRDSSAYKEYFVLRADAYGWGNSDFNINKIKYDYSDINGNGDIWDDFRSNMAGATVSMDIDHSVTGNVYVTVTMVGTNGTTMTETYNQPVSATDDINAFLICDADYFVMTKAYLIPSKVTTVPDSNPVSITVTGAPTQVEFGNKDFWGDATATVTFADGSTKEITDTTDLSFTVSPDMTTIGTKTVTVSYSKTEQGNSCPAVSTTYTLQVTNAVSSLAVTTLPNIDTYYYYSSDSIVMDTTGIVVTATYSDGSTGVIPNKSLMFSKIPAATGSQNAVISYMNGTKMMTTTCQFTLVKGTGQVGANDFTNAWWTTFSSDTTVASGDSVTFKMYCYSDNLANWHSPCTILRKASALPTSDEYAVVRMDNYGWGNSYGAATLTNDWPSWDIFVSNISGSKVVITVKNNGDNTADVIYNVTYANGETHFQKYTGITIDSSDLSTALVTEESYLVFIQ